MADDIPPAADPIPMGEQPAPAQKIHEYTGEIRRGDKDGGTIHGFLIDKLGYRISLRGHKDARPGHGYFLYGEVTHIPDAWRIAIIDGEDNARSKNRAVSKRRRL